MMKAEEVCRELIPCDIVEIECVGGKLFCIIGFRRSTKDDTTSYYEKDGERYDFDYIDRSTIASGKNEPELIDSIRTYAKVSKMTMDEFLLSPESEQILARIL